MPVLAFRPFLTVGSVPPDRRRTRAAAPAHRQAGAAVADTPPRPGDVSRFRELMLPHLDAAYGFARFLARDPDVAEDVVQDAFLNAWRAFAGYRGGEPKAWLFAIVRAQFLTRIRRERPWTGMAGTEEAEAVADPGDSPERRLLRESDQATVRAAVEALPEPFREAIVLRELQEMSYREIAEITDVPIGTVMSRLARARRMLAESLAAEDRP